ncbi:hypothetical protein B0H14DRAFT_3631052 [Mycena olivaceomarginata]|nr:hypothetical protein B0H14DRAFT_3631052 [Mycena olivaceomarginata]
MLYCRLLDAAVAILNMLAALSMSLVGVELDEHILPVFQLDWDGVCDSESTFEAVGSWLANSQLDLAAGIVAMDLQSHREIGCDFPISAFVDHVRSLALYQAGTSLEKGQMFFVPTKDVGSMLKKHNEEVRLRQSAPTHAQ